MSTEPKLASGTDGKIKFLVETMYEVGKLSKYEIFSIMRTDMD